MCGSARSRPAWRKRQKSTATTASCEGADRPASAAAVDAEFLIAAEREGPAPAGTLGSAPRAAYPPAPLDAPSLCATHRHARAGRRVLPGERRVGKAQLAPASIEQSGAEPLGLRDARDRVSRVEPGSGPAPVQNAHALEAPVRLRRPCRLRPAPRNAGLRPSGAQLAGALARKAHEDLLLARRQLASLRRLSRGPALRLAVIGAPAQDSERGHRKHDRPSHLKAPARAPPARSSRGDVRARGAAFAPPAP